MFYGLKNETLVLVKNYAFRSLGKYTQQKNLGRQ